MSEQFILCQHLSELLFQVFHCEAIQWGKFNFLISLVRLQIRKLADMVASYMPGFACLTQVVTSYIHKIMAGLTTYTV